MTDIEQVARGLVDVARRSTKPLACSLMGAADVATGVQMLQEAHVPHYTLPEHACRAMGDVREIMNWRARPAAAAAGSFVRPRPRPCGD